MTRIQPGDCVRIPDGRLGRVREVTADGCKVRVRRPSGHSDEFVDLAERDLEITTCPKGWMTPAGYLRYLAGVHAALRERQARSPHVGSDKEG